MTELPGRPAKSEIILYQTEDGKTRLQVRFQGETVWLPLNQMVELFQRDKSVAGKTNHVHRKTGARCSLVNSGDRAPSLTLTFGRS